MTQRDLGRAVRRPQSTVSEWENGSLDMTMEMVAAVEEALELPPGRLGFAAGYVDASVAPRAAIQIPGTDPPANSFVSNLIRWMVESGSLVEAILILTAYGDLADAEALRSSRPVQILLSGWNLQEALTAEGEDLMTEVSKYIRPSVIADYREALWGERPADGPTQIRALD